MRNYKPIYQRVIEAAAIAASLMLCSGNVAFANSSLTLEAEDAATNQNVFNDSSASAGQAVDWARSGTLDWQVNAPSAGNYTINIGYALAYGSRWLNVEVNGSDTQRVDFPNTGNWGNYANKSVTVRLSVGQNTVSLVKSDGSGPNIDNLKMSSAPSDWIKCADEGQTCNGISNSLVGGTIRYGVPGKWAYRYGVQVSSSTGFACNNVLSEFGDPAPGQVKACYISDELYPSRKLLLRLEAEDASTNQNVFNDSSASLGKAVDWARSGTLDWQVNAPSAGNYTINIGYALAYGSRWLNVEVNGRDTQRVDFPNTGNWRNYADKSVTIRLSAGQNTVSLVKSNGSGPNIDNLKMIPEPSIDSNLRNVNLRYPTSIETLHTVHNDSAEEFLASTLTEGETLESPDRNSILLMQYGGNLVLYSKGVMQWESPDINSKSGDKFTFHVMPNGIEVRRNNTVVWSARPAKVSNDTNYLLSLDNDGTLTLNDLEENRVRWRVSGSTAQFRTDDISDSTIENLYAKAGWDYTADWDDSDHETFRRLNKDRSFWTAHEFYTYMDKSLDALGVVEDVLDPWGYIKARADDEITQELMADAVHDVFGDKTPKQVIDFARGMSKLVNDLHNQELDLRDMFAEEMDRLADGEMVELEDGTMLERTHDQISNVLDSVTLAEGRKLDETIITCEFYVKLCNSLSKTENSGRRIDYALEFSATAALETMKGKYFGDLSAGWVNQLQLRIFFTHPRINSEGNFANEIRVRIMDFTGVYGSAGLENDYVSADISGDGGGVAVHDIIMPFTWPSTSKEWRKAKFEGAKYLSLTGIMVEGAIDFKLNFNKLFEQAQEKIARIKSAVEVITPAPLQYIAETELVEVSELAVEAIFSETVSDVLSAVTESAAPILDEVADMPRKFDSNIGVESGAGFSPFVFVYDINEMVDLGKSKGWLDELNNPPLKIFQIITLELLGAVALPILAIGDGTQEVALLGDMEAGLGYFNTNVMVGGLIGDLLYYGVQTGIFGNNEGIWFGRSAFWWVAGKAGFAWDAPSIGTWLENAYGVAQPARGSAKIRMQLNGTYKDKEYFLRGNPRLKSYGSFKLKTLKDKCVYVVGGFFNGVPYQRDCTNLGLGIEDSETWLAKPLGDEADNIYQLRSQAFPDSCIGLGQEDYDLGNPSLYDGVTAKFLPCITSSSVGVDVKADRWKFRRLGRKTMFTSVLDPTKCLNGQDSNDESPLQLSDCDLGDADQHFKQEYTTGISDEGWRDLKTTYNRSHRYTIRAHNSQSCIGNALSKADFTRGVFAHLQYCDNSLTDDYFAFQTFYMVELENGYYKILRSNTRPGVIDNPRLYLAVDGPDGGYTNNGAEVKFWTVVSGTEGVDKRGHNQQWQPIVQTDGSVKLKVRHTGKCLQREGVDNRLIQHTCSKYGEDDTKQKFLINREGYKLNRGYN
jgi:hypothetical protein